MDWFPFALVNTTVLPVTVLLFVEEIKRLDGIQDQVKEFYKNNKQRFEDNKQKVWNMLNIVEKDYQFFESLI